MNYTTEEYNDLKEIEDKLYTALYCNFVRIPNRANLEKADRIYKRKFKSTQSLIGGCTHCVMTAFKKLGNLYFADKSEYEAIEVNKVTEKAEKAPETPKKAQKTATKNKTATTKNKKK